MHGGIQYDTLNLNDGLLNEYQTIIKSKDLLNQTKNKDILEKIKNSNTKNQNAESLIEYFEGMILKYINLYESRGENVDELKKFILNEDKYTKFESENNDNSNNKLKGGYTDDMYNGNILKLNSTDNNWGKIEIEYDRILSRQYIIRISHSYNTLNAFNLEINIGNCTIMDHIYGIFNTNLYTNTTNITGILEIIIQKLMEYDYNDNINNIGLTLKNDISTMSSEKGYNIRILIRSIISTLILILTIRTGTNKNIYKKYNNTFLLLAVSKFLLYNYAVDDYINSAFLFNGTNFNQLTYEEKKPYKYIAAFHGDCALNVLICKTVPEIQELLIEKINYIENKNEAHNDVYYYDKIRAVLNNLNVINELNCTNSILKYVEGYQLFINYIKNNEYQVLKNEINHLNKMITYIYNIINTIRQMNNNDIAAIYRNQNNNRIQACLNIVNNNINDFNIYNINNNYYKKLSSYIIYNSNNIDINQIKFINNEYKDNLEKSVVIYINNINIKVKNLFNNLLKYIHVLRNNLLDFDIGDAEATNICENLSSNLISINNVINEIINGIINDNNIKNIHNTYNKLINIIDYFINNHSKKFNIFYINVLISLLLIQYKIDYVFDDDIMNVLRYSNNKNNIINCFRNVEENINETKIILPEYYESNGEKYLFMNTILTNENHTVLSIIKIDNTNSNNKIYLYEINSLNIICHEYLNLKNIIPLNSYECDNYKLDNKNSTLLKNKFKNQILQIYHNEIRIWFFDIRKIYNKDIYDLTNLGEIINNNNSLNIYFNNNLFNLFSKNYKGKLNLTDLLKINYNNRDNFENTYKNIKRAIFEKLLICCVDLYNINTDTYVRTILQNIYLKIENLINDNTYTLRNLLFKFVECLVKARYDTRITNNILVDIANCFNKAYNLNANSFIAIFNTGNQRLNDEIVNVINILNFNLNDYELNGGYKDINCCDNSIIKKVLIILLIILIIIIIVLIVLYIINKYKNNNNFV